jgi:hypothetical protein
VFHFQFTFKLLDAPDSEAPIVLERWFCWKEMVYLLDTANLAEDHSAHPFCYASLGVQ